MSGRYAGLDVLFDDVALLVLNKPAGLLTVPGRGSDKQDCLSARVQAVWSDALVVHRLDMATSGLVVMARGLAAQRSLSQAFEQRKVFKRYIAIASGQRLNPLADNAWNLIDLPLLLDWPNRPRSAVNFENGKPSQTRWRLSPIGQHPKRHTGIATRLELDPITGRSHQLRVHLQAIGHPIVGDPLYAPLDVLAQADRLLLHAQTIDIPHPTTGERLRFESPCPF